MKIDLIDYPSDYDWMEAKRLSLAVCLCQCVSIAVEYVMKCMGVVKNNDR